jgi:hypothetical protein
MAGSLSFFPLPSDPEKDSVSYHLKIPETGKNTLLTHYRFPGSRDPVSGLPVSNLSVEEMSGNIHWDKPDLPGDHDIAVEIKEWRYVEDYGTWYEISATTYGFNFLILETTNNEPAIVSI